MARCMIDSKRLLLPYLLKDCYSPSFCGRFQIEMADQQLIELLNGVFTVEFLLIRV